MGSCGAAGVHYFGHHFGLIDIPNRRSSHTRPTPKGGGIGILAAFLFIAVISRQPLLFTAAAAAVALLGLIGDRTELRPRLRLAIQFFCALLAVLALMGKPADSLQLFLVLLWMVFIVGTANFYNFMDGINGIAGLTGAIAFGSMALLLHLDQIDPSLQLLSLCLASGCLGFLPFNLPRARVFMGDVGSVLLGFVFGVCILRVSGSVLDFLCYAALLFPFYIDELSTMAIRLQRGEHLAQAHRSHLYQLLANENNIAHWKVSLFYGLLQGCVAIGVFSLKRYGSAAVLLFLLIAAVVFLLFSYSVRSRHGRR